VAGVPAFVACESASPMCWSYLRLACLQNKYCKNSPTWNWKTFRLASLLPRVSWTTQSSFHEAVAGRSTLTGDGVLESCIWAFNEGLRPSRSGRRFGRDHASIHHLPHALRSGQLCGLWGDELTSHGCKGRSAELGQDSGPPGGALHVVLADAPRYLDHQVNIAPLLQLDHPEFHDNKPFDRSGAPSFATTLRISTARADKISGQAVRPNGISSLTRRTIVPYRWPVRAVVNSRSSDQNLLTSLRARPTK